MKYKCDTCGKAEFEFKEINIDKKCKCGGKIYRYFDPVKSDNAGEIQRPREEVK
jgi:predicted  nucleic acid-binding Zn-ribbon protein